MPAGNYEDNADCTWTVHCDRGDTPTVTFTSFDTEGDYDFVSIYNSATAGGATAVAELSGAMVDLERKDFTGQGADLTLEFLSDESEGAGGFVATYACGQGGH